MADFLRPPDWDQHAHRHSGLIDPVVTVRQLSRFDYLPGKRLTRIDYALVYTTPKGMYETYLPPQRPTTTRRYTAVYEVDMGVHPVRADLRLPSDNDAHEFEMDVALDWQVADPAQYVRSGCRDVPKLLIGELEQAVRPVARQFPIAESATTEAEILTALHGQKPLGEAAGLRTTWTVRLRRDADNIEHQRRLQAIQHTAEQDILLQRRGAEVDVETAARAMVHGQRQHELGLQRQQWEQEQAVVRAQYELELQQYEARKVDFYQRHLAQGGVQAWALHLARRPEDTKPVLDGMREHELDLIKAQIDLVKQLLGGGKGEAHELEAPKQIVLQMISDFFSQRLPRGSDVPAPALPSWQPPPGYGQAPVQPEAVDDSTP
ncbi:hypothetical protein AB0D94_23530 [Streptomyces sp. NPDC048255]|uniref:hypothetical protein n=1 Tax=Streptomyces sp. NPDC048255 TaxID=3154713 RepID=UPI0033C39A80